MLILSSKGEIIFEEENCLDVSKSYPGAPVEILKCHGMGGNQKWEHDKKSVSRRLNFSSLRSLSRSQRFHYIMYTSDWSFVLSEPFECTWPVFLRRNLESTYILRMFEWLKRRILLISTQYQRNPVLGTVSSDQKLSVLEAGRKLWKLRGVTDFFFFFSIFFWNFILFYLEGLGMGVHTPYNVDNWITAVQGCYHFFLSPGNY